MFLRPLQHRFYFVEGDSMQPTLYDCDIILIDTRYRGGVDISVGDVVAMWHPHKSQEGLLKRVTGLEANVYMKRLRGLGQERVVVRG